MIGWREISRKLLLYLSDAGFHFAGDGLVSMLATHPDLLFTYTRLLSTTHTHTHTCKQAYAPYNYTLRFSCAFASRRSAGGCGSSSRWTVPHGRSAARQVDWEHSLSTLESTGNNTTLLSLTYVYVMALITGLPLNWTNRRKAVRI